MTIAKLDEETARECARLWCVTCAGLAPYHESMVICRGDHFYFHPAKQPEQERRYCSASPLWSALAAQGVVP